MVDYAFQKAPVWTWNSTPDPSGRANITTCPTFYSELFRQFYPCVETHSERVIDSWGNHRYREDTLSATVYGTLTDTLGNYRNTEMCG